MLALNRVDIKTLEVKNCQEHLDNLREKYDSILASEEFEIFRPYRNVLSKLCVLSMLAKDEVTIEQYIEKRQLEIEKNEREIEQTEQQLKTIDVHEFIQKDIEYFEYE